MSDSLVRGKERLLKQLFRYISFALVVLILPGLYIAYTKFIPVLFVFDLVAVSLYFYLAFSNRFGYKALLIVYLVTAFTVAPVILFKTGPYGTGYLWLSSGVIVSALCGKRLAIILSSAGMVIVYGAYGFFMLNGFVDVTYPVIPYLITGANLFTVTMLLSFIVYQLLNMAQTAVDAERGYAGHLEEELDANEKIRRQLTDALEQKSFMLQELNHRVKNNMQVISSLINLTDYNKTHQEYVQVLKNRIRSITAVHYQLFSESGMRTVNLARLVESISKSVQQNLQHLNISLSFESRQGNLPIHPDRAVNIALVMNEIISNAYKHAFEGCARDKKRVINISANVEGPMIVLTVYDNGRGFVRDKDSQGLGLTLVEKLLSQSDASFDIISNNEGTTVTVLLDKDTAVENPQPKSRGTAVQEKINSGR